MTRFGTRRSESARRQAAADILDRAGLQASDMPEASMTITAGMYYRDASPCEYPGASVSVTGASDEGNAIIHTRIKISRSVLPTSVSIQWEESI